MAGESDVEDPGHPLDLLPDLLRYRVDRNHAPDLPSGRIRLDPDEEAQNCPRAAWIGRIPPIPFWREETELARKNHKTVPPSAAVQLPPAVTLLPRNKKTTVPALALLPTLEPPPLHRLLLLVHLPAHKLAAAPNNNGGNPGADFPSRDNNF